MEVEDLAVGIGLDSLEELSRGLFQNYALAATGRHVGRSKKELNGGPASGEVAKDVVGGAERAEKGGDDDEQGDVDDGGGGKARMVVGAKREG